MGIKSEQLKDWADFKRRIAFHYMKWSQDMRDGVWFRGQSDANMPLLTSLDRWLGQEPVSDAVRLERASRLVAEFRQNSYGLITNEHPEEPEEWEFLGRHHGLPTLILDWTLSPYIAAYFAFEPAETELAEKPDFASVWVLDGRVADLTKIEGIELLDAEDVVRYNLRAVEQRGRAMRITSVEPPLESRIENICTRLDIPWCERKTALVELDEMTINRRSLFRTLDAAAIIAKHRVERIT